MARQIVNICDVCTEIFAGGDAPKDRLSEVCTPEYSVPVYSNGEANEGLYGYTDRARVFLPSITVSARGTIGFTAIRNEPFVPIVRLISITPDPSQIDIKYLYYAAQNYHFDGSGTSIPQLTVPMLKNYSFPLPSIPEQQHIAAVLDKVSDLIALRKQQLAKLDELVKARFVEMFGDPINNTQDLPLISIGEACYLKAGITTSADAIFEFDTEHQIPCYGGNGIRGYVKKSTQHGTYPIIGRQGALCGNVQLATGSFHATEHAVLVSPLINLNIFWLYYLLKYMDLYRFHTGAAQPGLAVKTLNTVSIPIANIKEQDIFSKFAKQVEQSKSTVQQGLDKLETLKSALMQEYFG